MYARLADPAGPAYAALTEREQRLARMLFFLLWPDRGGSRLLRRRPRRTCAATPPSAPRSGSWSRSGSTAPDTSRRPLGEGLQHVPLQSHAHYRREEILAALGWASFDRKAYGHAQGVAWAPEVRTDALLVNLRKTERDFSPTTMYRDYAISPELFHWESQNSTSVASEPGQRYLHHRERGTHVALFVREAPTDDLGLRSVPVPRTVRLRRAPGRAAHRSDVAAAAADAGGDVPGRERGGVVSLLG